jgi:tetratricopeptide (TPR) repeat protein
MKTWLWSSLLVICLGLNVGLQVWMDAQRGSGAAIEEALYVSSGKTLKRTSLGFDGLLADLYWLRTIQYFGRKIEKLEGRININDVSSWHLDLLEPLLNITTELDPHYVAAYRFGALFLPDINPEGAVRFVERAIRDNPNEWRLYQDLGYIFWKQGRFREASEAYERGSRVPGAPAWMQTMPAVMLAKGGDRETAREMFQRIYENTDDNFVRQIALARLQGFRAQDEIDFLSRLMAAYRERRGACPASLAGFIKSLPASAVDQLTAAGLRFDPSGAPLDPEGFAYDYNPATCAVTISEKSTVARWKF